jgi:UDP-glucose 4-epimerase
MATDKKVLILGGLGFIGKNLYNSLTKIYTEVKILTESVREAEDGFLTSSIRKNIILGSILDKDFMEHAVIGYDVIFSLAGSSGAADSIKDPYHDLDTNLKGHLNILEACRKANPKALLIFPSSRLVYGRPEKNPVSEDQVIHPESIYAIHKLTTEHYYLLYKKLYDINCIIFRVSNPYGPYQKFGSNHYGILNWFIHKAINKEDIEIYGDGSQKRDFIYIDDLIRLFMLSIDKKKMFGKIYNVGLGKGISLREAVDVITKYIPHTKSKLKPWPEIDKKIETGDYISDVTKLKLDAGWEPLISFDEGIKMTIEFYGRK